ncbi:stealth conserved region 3 domain-containing protein [Sansalvadorimonas sp. 2012CJ34-2]|uniref:Stealth conserved region 3 domain-containing protein n=1 Tax=Parendozoicomonas callyspongiae TaxID=2942213 RepID=A0ABT0PHB9_9GAMM|nr:stealth conserved region 3 domain-containing protein [Sansalvadorimonas sp. 2012CJ34-2]MCL6270768.1 stealth conserved region 3 domain-containing protein [Sansalvadorimonas sp. 2012CJ34-2]
MNKKIRKLVNNPNRFFFDYFAKRLGNDTKSKKIETVPGRAKSNYILPASFQIDKKIHPLIQVAKTFELKTGACSGHPDQSLLVSSLQHLIVLQYVCWLAHGFGCEVRLYTLGGAVDISIKGSDLLNINKIEGVFSEFYKKSDYVVEIVGEFENNFAAHLFIYDEQDELFIVRSNKAYVKKCLKNKFANIYPDVINNFGGYEFGTPWPVDIIYTWVNKDDEGWVEKWNSNFPEKPFDPDRFSSKDELKYSLRALCKFLPWFHNVYIVSNCDRPTWLKDHPGVKWVNHEEIFPSSDMLPTFNSHAIEACLHRIDGLNERFIYFNDDMFVNRPCYYHDFYDEMGRTICHFEPYGMIIDGNHFDQEKDYLSPSINSQNIIKAHCPEYLATKLHKHSPYALRKSVVNEIENLCPDEFQATRSARLRTPNDLNITSFLYHHYAIAKGKAVAGDFPYLIVRPKNFEQIKGKKVRKYQYICFNDGDGSATDKDYTKNYYEVVNKLYTNKGDFEIEHKSWSSVQISKTIMAYVKREHRIPLIRKKIGDAKVSLDDGSWGLWGNAKKSWLTFDMDADYHMVIQDDSVVCDNFYVRLAEVFSRQPFKSVTSLFYRYKSRKTHFELNEAARSNRVNKGFYFPRLQWATGVVVPKELVANMVRFADKLPEKKFKNIDDLRFSKFFTECEKIEVYYPLPSLVDQSIDCGSTIGNGDNIGRQATWFIDKVGNDLTDV